MNCLSGPPVPINDLKLLEQLECMDDGGAIAMLRDEDAKPLGLPLSTEAKGKI